MTEPTYNINIVEAPPDALPDDTILLFPGPRRVVHVHLPDGRVVERGETLDEYARRCVAVRNVQS